jgi:heterodisulfide reductase subunit A-like polyferredoxin
MSAKQTSTRLYLCRCGPNMAEHLDLEQIAPRRFPATARWEASYSNDTLCSVEGQAWLAEDLKQSGATRLCGGRVFAS